MDSTTQQRERLRDEIDAACEEKGWSAAELSRQSGVSETTLTKIKRLQRVDRATIKKLRDTLGIVQRHEVYDPSNYDLDVQITCEMIGQWLQAIEDLDRRRESSRYIVRCMVARSNEEQ